ncbi:hypothetical protein [Hymenobacter koreensis]|uniref:Uncharacterized protein n=1 Tax=Hymenobacter koreensis TaxID=1084523 RepID=A0ABP8JNC7_9BACT
MADENGNYRIPDLDSHTTATTPLAQDWKVPVYSETDDKTYEAPVGALLDTAFANQLRGVPKIVDYLEAFTGMPAQAIALDQLYTLFPNGLSLGVTATVRNTAAKEDLQANPNTFKAGGQYVLTASRFGLLNVWRNGGGASNAGTSAKAKATWLAVESPAAQGPGIEEFDPIKQGGYPIVGTSLKLSSSGYLYFFTTRVPLPYDGITPIPEPTIGGDDNYTAEPPPVSSYESNIILPQAAVSGLFTSNLGKGWRVGPTYTITDRYPQNPNDVVDGQDYADVYTRWFRPSDTGTPDAWLFSNGVWQMGSYDAANNLFMPAPAGGGPGVTVVQTTGQSTTAVMSQKAVSERLLTADQQTRVAALTSPAYYLGSAGLEGFATLDDLLAVAANNSDGTVVLNQQFLSATVPGSFGSNTVYGQGALLDPGEEVDCSNAAVHELVAGSTPVRAVGGASYFNSSLGLLTLDAATVFFSNSTAATFSGTGTVNVLGRWGVGAVNAGVTLVFKPSALIPAGYLATLTNNNDGTYTTPEGGTVVDERESGESNAETEIQCLTTSALRVSEIKLNKPLTLVSVEAKAAYNAGGATYQVNTYTGSAWAGGAVRTTVPAAQADLAAVTEAQRTAGAELLIATAPVAPNDPATLIVTVLYG